MERTIRRAAVLGAGVMGAAIAAHLANAGIRVLLLDRVPEAGETPAGEGKAKAAGVPSRSGLAEQALQRLARQKPSPVYSAEVLRRVEAGNFEDHRQRIGEVDWIIEAIVENLEAKRELLKRIEPHWKPGTIVSSNTSGLPIRRIAEGRSYAFRRHFLGTHFFNPPRYMKLLEIVPAPDTDPALVEFMADFCRLRLGKGVVVAKDTPNFIANRIGTFGLLATLEAMERLGLSVAAADALTGPVIGRPRSATFRTLDLVGLDTFVQVIRNVREQVSDPAEKARFAVPPLLERLVREGRLGEKTGKGFYQAVPGKDGEKQILQLNLSDLSYVPREKVRLAALDAARSAKGTAERLKALIAGQDAGSALVWHVLKRVLIYSAAKIPEICDDPASLDLAMKWGFGWELGPFEIWDAIGVSASAARMEREGENVPEWVSGMLAAGRGGFYRKASGRTFTFTPRGAEAERKEPPQMLSLEDLKEQNRIVKKNAGASLIDLGDGVACLEIHSPNSTIGPDVTQMLFWSLEEVRRNYRGLVIGHQGKNFCVGANLMLLLMEAQDGNWPEIGRMVDQLQQAAMAIKYFEKPVVAAPFAQTLGGGVELCLPSARVQAAAETYMGLVETGVGVIPAGGGTKELLCRFTAPVDFDRKIDLQPFVNRAFETIGLAKVSASAAEAKQLGYLRESDGITMNADFLLHDAKQAALGLAIGGYVPPAPRPVRVVGEPGLAVLRMALYQMRCAGQISDHDAKIGGKLAHVLCGGAVSENSLVSEQYLLDLEKEAFLSLCGEPKTQARMQHMLLTRKPLRN